MANGEFRGLRGYTKTKSETACETSCETFQGIRPRNIWARDGHTTYTHLTTRPVPVSRPNGARHSEVDASGQPIAIDA